MNSESKIAVKIIAELMVLTLMCKCQCNFTPRQMCGREWVGIYTKTYVQEKVTWHIKLDLPFNMTTTDLPQTSTPLLCQFPLPSVPHSFKNVSASILNT